MLDITIKTNKEHEFLYLICETNSVVVSVMSTDAGQVVARDIPFLEFVNALEIVFLSRSEPHISTRVMGETDEVRISRKDSGIQVQVITSKNNAKVIVQRNHVKTLLEVWRQRYSICD